MKRKSLFLAAAMLTVIGTGCEYLQGHKDEIHAAIIQYAENQGQDAAIAYVDKLVAEGKLGKENGEKIKAAIPQGIDKLKETMKTEEEEK